MVSMAHAWNGCSRSSRFPTAGHRERSSGNEIGLGLVHSRPQSHDPSDLRQGSRALAGPDFLGMCRVYSDLPDLTGSPWIADFRCWTKPELSIPAAGQKDCGSGDENGSGLNLLCLQSHSKQECRWTWPGLSDWLALKGGVPQGTKLGVILFTVMTNRLLSDWRLRIKYVDDTSALEIIPRNSPSVLNAVASDIHNFAIAHNMRLNPIKCKEMHNI